MQISDLLKFSRKKNINCYWKFKDTRCTINLILSFSILFRSFSLFVILLPVQQRMTLRPGELATEVRLLPAIPPSPNPRAFIGNLPRLAFFKNYYFLMISFRLLVMISIFFFRLDIESYLIRTLGTMMSRLDCHVSQAGQGIELALGWSRNWSGDGLGPI